MIRKKQKYIILIVLLLLFISIGYAVLNAQYRVNGRTNIAGARWNLYLDHVSVKAGGVTPTSGPTINGNNVEYEITLSKPGDAFEFTFNVNNRGTINAMIGSISSKLNDVDMTTPPDYLDYLVEYYDGEQITNLQALNVGETDTIRVRVEYKTDIDASAMPTTNQQLKFDFNISYIQADNSAISRSHYLYSLNDNVPLNSSVNDYDGFYSSYQELYNSTGKPYFLKHKISNDLIIENSLGFVYNNNYYFLSNTSFNYQSSSDYLVGIFGSNCTASTSITTCNVAGFNPNVYSSGHIDVHNADGGCAVTNTLTGSCY
ncbi:MAG: hypothetical protein IKQ29_02995 [Bacilli bacterium]|nr:hypothetical protein [Bacilli bacterium]